MSKAFKCSLNGYGDIYADPVQIRRDLLRISEGRIWQMASAARQIQDRLEELSKAEQSEQREAEEASLTVQLVELEGSLVGCAYRAFDLPPIDRGTGAGVPESEMAAVLRSYLGYAEKKD